MDKLKTFLDSMIKTAGKILLVLALLIMIGVMTIWTIGIVYIANQGDCSIEQDRVVCSVEKTNE